MFAASIANLNLSDSERYFDITFSLSIAINGKTI